LSYKDDSLVVGLGHADLRSAGSIALGGGADVTGDCRIGLRQRWSLYPNQEQ